MSYQDVPIASMTPDAGLPDADVSHASSVIAIAPTWHEPIPLTPEGSVAKII